METSTNSLLGVYRPQPLNEDVLEVLNGPEDGRLFPLGLGAATIGRLETAEIALALDRSISRTHARVTREQDRYFVEDLESNHGTFVNGQVIRARTQLEDGDEILVGGTLMRLRRRQV